MDIIEKSRNCLDYGNVNESVLNELALSASQSGITLIGGAVGSGKSSTTESFLQHLKNNYVFNAAIVYIDTYELKDADYRHVKSGISDTFHNLIKDNSHKRLFVVIDEINSLEAFNAIIALADAGHSVLGVVQTAYTSELGAVLASIMDYVDVGEKEIFAKRLIQNANLFVLQLSHCSQVDSKPEYRYISCPVGLKDALIRNIDEYGLEYTYNELSDAANCVGVHGSLFDRY